MTDDRDSLLIQSPIEGATLTRIVVMRKTYRWEIDDYGTGDWYEIKIETVLEHPAWKDVPGVE